jgi:hypothetical protein
MRKYQKPLQISPDVHYRLKIFCVEKNLQMGTLVNKLIEEHLDKTTH